MCAFLGRRCHTSPTKSSWCVPQVHHTSRLRWIQEYMGVRALELGELCISYGNLRDTRTALAKETVCCKPWGSGTLLNILAKSDIDGIVIFRYITIDVVEPAVANLHIDVASEYHFKKTHPLLLCAQRGLKGVRKIRSMRRCASEVCRGLDTRFSSYTQEP